MQIDNQRIRLAIDTSQMGSINDVLTGGSPKFWNGVDLQFELGIFRGAALVDISNFDSITVDLKDADPRTGLPLMSKTLASGSFNAGLTLDAWNGGASADCHALLAFTNSETNLDLSDDQVTFWLVVSALTNDTPAHKIVLGATPITVIEGGEGVTPPSYVATPVYYTAAQADARYQLSVDLTAINAAIATLNSEMTAVTATANAALPKAGGTMSGALTITGLSGVLKAPSGVLTGGATTSDLTEGSNLYFTNARADARITNASGAASGICPLDSGSLVPVANLPPAAFVSTSVVASQAAMLALSVTKGAVAIRTDLNETFILSSNSPSTLLDWKQILAPLPPVTSVNSLTGAVVLDTALITENTNLYYTTVRATAAALAATLSGFSSASGGSVTSGDTILSALGKHENRMVLNDAKVDGSDRVKKDGSTPMTGVLTFSGAGNAGLQLQNLNSTQIAALSPVTGQILTNSTSANQIQYWNGSAWVQLAQNTIRPTLFTDFGPPLLTILGSSIGDFYLDTSTGDVYELLAFTGWTKIMPGPVFPTGGTITGPLSFTTGKIKLIESGGAPLQGTVALNGTTAVVVSTTAVTASSRIWLSVQTTGGTMGTPYVSARTANTSFSLKSSNASDTSTVAWFITEPA